MTGSRRCSRCGKPLSDRDQGLCPSCLVQLALEAGGETMAGTPAPEAATVSGTPAPARAEANVHARAAGDHIGPYRLVKVIGEGGMGVVYLAEQTEPIRRTVALKLIKLGMDTREVVARFEAERQTLALMDHPNIASVLDAGATADGRPYFVMEYAPGVPITEYCDTHQLSTIARLQLFITVCGAVQHAHQKGVIHRDLKPSNVLIVEQDGVPTPKVIDFGIAKATDQRMAERTQFTQHGLLVGTPEYMSPEQTDPLTADLDTRTDIYSLGVVLYELLVGGLPFPPTRLREAGYTELLRIIREEEPPRPSARLTGLGATATDVALRRQTKPPTLAGELRGDLDWITLKALEKDRGRRYSSASELAADLGRYLQHEPVVARPPSVRYRVEKFIRRNRAGVVAATVVATAVIAGLVASTVLYLRADRERRAADVARAEAASNASSERVARQRADSSAAAEAQARQRESEQRAIAENQTTATQSALESAERQLYLNGIQSAEREWLAGNTAQVDQILSDSPISRRGWEYHLLSRLNHTEAATFSVPTLDVRSLTFSVDGRRLIGVTDDLHVLTWDVERGRLLSNVTLADAAANGFISSGIRVNPFTFSTRILKMGGGGSVVAAATGAGAKQLTVWDTSTGAVRFVKASNDLPHPANTRVDFRDLDCSADGRYLVTSARVTGTGTVGANAEAAGALLQVWDATTGSLVSTLPENTEPPELVQLSPDGSLLAFARPWIEDHKRLEIGVLELATGNVVETHGTSGFDSPVRSVSRLAFSRDRAFLAASYTYGGSDVGKGVQFWWAEGKSTWRRETSAAPRDLALSPDKRWVVVSLDDRSIRIYAAWGDEVGRLSGHTGDIHALTFSPDGQWLATGAADRTVRLWRLPFINSASAKLAQPHADRNLVNAIVNSDGSRLIAVTMDQQAPGATDSARTWLESYETGSGRLVYSVPFMSTATLDNMSLASWYYSGGPIASRAGILAVPDYQTTTALDGTTAITKYGVRILDAVSGTTLRTLREPASRPAPGSAQKTSDLIFDVEPNETGKRLLVLGGTNDGKLTTWVHTWNVESGIRVRTIPISIGDETPMRLVVSPSERIGALVSIGAATSLPADKSYQRSVTRLRLVDLTAGSAGRPLEGFDGANAESPVFSHSGQAVAAITGDHSITVWDVDTGRIRFKVPGTSQLVTDVVFSPDDERLLCAALDATVVVRDARTGTTMLTLRPPSVGPLEIRELTISGLGDVTHVISSVRFSADGRQVILLQDDRLNKKIGILRWTVAPRRP